MRTPGSSPPTIESGVPRVARGTRYGFANMKIDDSFVAPLGERQAIFYEAKLAKMRIETRRIGATDNMRVWRIA